jgi:oxygen-independent coproporphyrinogen-3 oxidase
MIGLGCGARSYTEALHYSSEYAVGRSGVKSILADYVSKSSADFAVTDYGVRLDREEQRRRHIVKSLLQAEGLALDDYHRRFGSSPQGDLPELALLPERGLADLRNGRLILTESGLERSDAIGPWLYSAEMAHLMEEYELQ